MSTERSLKAYATGKYLAEATIQSLKARGAQDAVAGHTGTALANAIALRAQAISSSKIVPGAIVGIENREPTSIAIGCLSAWAAECTPAIGLDQHGVRLSLAIDGSITTGGNEADRFPDGLIVAEDLVGCIAHPFSSLGLLQLPRPIPDAVSIIADWRIDAWLPLLVEAWLAGVRQINLYGARDPVGTGKIDVLALPASALAFHSGFIGENSFDLLSWGPASMPTELRLHRLTHGQGDHFIVAATKVAGGGNFNFRGTVPGRHRVCNADQRPIPPNAWGWLALAGQLPGVDVDPSSAMAMARNERTILTGERARARSDGSIEFSQDPCKSFAGRPIDTALAASLLRHCGISGALLPRDSGSHGRRLALHVSEHANLTLALPKLLSALPAWAQPLSLVTLPVLPFDAKGDVAVDQLTAASIPDELMLAEAAASICDGVEGAELHVSYSPPTPVQQLIPPIFAAAVGRYPQDRPAAVSGPKMSAPADNLVDRLCQAARGPRGLILVDANGAERTLSYHSLLEDAARIAGYLTEQGVVPGQEVVVHCADAGDMFAGLWGCILAGALAVPLAPAANYEAETNPLWYLMGPDSILDCRLVLASHPQITATKAALASRKLSATILSLDAARATAPLAPEQFAPQHHAVILLTSGSTGAPKGVALSHRNIVALGDSVGREFQLGDEKSLNWLGVDHVGGLIQHHMRDLCLDNMQVHVSTPYVLEKPARLLDLCDKYRVTLLWMANFGFNLLNEQADEIAQGTWDLTSIKIWENGGEPVTHADNQRFLSMLAPFGLRPDVIRPVFGMTETSSAIIAADNLVAGSERNVHWLAHTRIDLPVARALPGEGSAFVEVGRPMAGISMRIVDADGRTCPEGTIGRVEVQGLQVMDGYYRNKEATAESFTDDGWLRMGDCGFIVDGSLTVTGRIKDIIIVNGLNFAARAIEAVVEGIPSVRAGCCAAVSVRPPDAVTDELVIFYGESGRGADVSAIEMALVDKFNLHPLAIVQLEDDDWPRTAIGKIRRLELAADFMEGAFAEKLRYERSERVADRSILKGGGYIIDWSCRGQGSGAGSSTLWIGENAPSSVKLAARRGPSFTGFDGAGRASFSGDSVADLAELIGAAIAHLDGPCVIVDARHVEPPAEDGSYAAAYRDWDALCRAAMTFDPAPEIVLWTSRSLAISADDPNVRNAALPGVARSLAQSYPYLNLRFVDALPTDAEKLAREDPASGNEPMVAYRGGDRFVPTLRAASSSVVPEMPRRVLRHGGRYLIIGGLGGIGAHLCEHLMRQFAADLIVAGRSAPTGPREAVLDLLLAQAAQGTGSLSYVQLDARDVPSLCEAIEAAERKWGAPLDAIFDLAGEGSIADQMITSDNSDSLAATRAHDRIQIIRALDKALENSAADLVVFSSVNGFFGGAGFTDYAAACAYQSTFMQWSARHRRGERIAIDWSMWKQIGLAVGAPATVIELARRRGFDRLDRTQGLAVLHVALDAEADRVLAGLSIGGTEIRPLLAFESFDWVVKARGCDRVRAAAALGIDQSRLMSAQHVARSVAMPVSPERIARLTEIFRKVLNRDDFDEQSNFFAAGGDSIRAIQAASRARQAGINFNALDLFEHKTVGALLENLAERSDGAGLLIEEADGSDSTTIMPPIFSWWLERAHSSAERNQFTMSMRFALDSKFSADDVNAALVDLVAAHDALRLRLEKQDCSWQLRVLSAKEAQPAFEHHQMDDDAAFSSATAKAIESELHQGLDIVAGPTLRAALLSAPQAAHRQLIIVVHHLAIDGVSWRILERWLRQRLDQGKPDEKDEEEAPSCEFMRWANLLARRVDLADGRALADYWYDHLQDSIALFPNHPERLFEGSTSVLSVTLPVKNATNTASVQEMLIAAASWSLRGWLGADIVSFDQEGHGRLQRMLPVNLDDTIGWFTTIAPLCVDMRGCRNASNLLTQIRDSLAEQIGRDAEWGMLRHMGLCPEDHPLMRLPERQISFNYLGIFGDNVAPDPVLSVVPGSLAANQCATTERPYLLDIAAQIDGATLRIGVKFSPEIHPEVTVAQWLDDFAAIVTELFASNSQPQDSIKGEDIERALAEVTFS